MKPDSQDMVSGLMPVCLKEPSTSEQMMLVRVWPRRFFCYKLLQWTDEANSILCPGLAASLLLL